MQPNKLTSTPYNNLLFMFTFDNFANQNVKVSNKGTIGELTWKKETRNPKNKK